MRNKVSLKRIINHKEKTMRGFPKHFETKNDFINGIGSYPEKTKAELRIIYADRFIWKETGIYTKKDSCIEDTTHMVVSEKKSDKIIYYHQYEKKVDTNARIYKLGFTDTEIRKLLF